MTTRQRRWRGAVAAGIALAAVGIATGNGVLLLGAVVPLVYVAYGAVSHVAVPADLTARRTVSPSPAPPGRTVTVSLEVVNDSDRTLPDVRVADAVPAELGVVEGSPRGAATLEPGDRLTVEYAMIARRGEYAFDPPQVRVRGLGAASVATTRPDTDGDRTLACRLDADAPPLERLGTERIGQLTTDRPGEGLTFHSTREYRPDDPAERIDWRHYAKRGTLATVNYERRVAATVVLVLDAREPNRVVAGPGRPTAVELSAYAATRSLSDLLGHGHDVGVAVVGLDGPGPAGLHWLEPGTGAEQRTRGLSTFRAATADDGSEGESGGSPGRESIRTSNWSRSDRSAEAGPPDVDEQIRKLIELAPSGAQLALFSPALDDGPVRAVETWRGAGLPVSLLSPDVIPANTTSGQYAQTRRRTRLARCQAVGARTVDWRRGTPLALVVEYAFSADARLSSARLSSGRGSGAGRTAERNGDSVDEGTAADSASGGDRTRTAESERMANREAETTTRAEERASTGGEE
ncbi:DUF58 domain-containing protein [Natrarchaeobius chitinivorans]|uniref:DUF58 domain-containing protein n=1 Tax=Natrarchaeobius chitinivorans TaxID=1679083 RepID=A0A3N6LR10_NATCH|nr:DUF58 domain-containing protein [Natrarchaeobius chitinivorans]RQG92118.1 DUF58 domain-containing protein [Natrarchaeobius chitinivorans]